MKKFCVMVLVCLLVCSCRGFATDTDDGIPWGTDIAQVKTLLLKNNAVIEGEFEQAISGKGKYAGTDASISYQFSSNNELSDKVFDLSFPPDSKEFKQTLLKIKDDCNKKYGTPKREENTNIVWEKDTMIVDLYSYSGVAIKDIKINATITVYFINKAFLDQKTLERYKELMVF